jgi:hypothetical protein
MHFLRFCKQLYTTACIAYENAVISAQGTFLTA